MSTTIDFGIDLGTTNSVIAKFVKGEVQVFKDPITWKDTLPSVVGFRKDTTIVGHKAKERQEKDPDLPPKYRSTLQLGKKVYFGIQREKGIWVKRGFQLNQSLQC